MPHPTPPTPVVARLDGLDPASTPARDGRLLHAIAHAQDAADGTNEQGRDAVRQARADGWGWGVIAVALGVTVQDARDRYG